MKKTLAAALAVMTLGAMAFAEQKVSVTNILGGNTDNTGAKDFVQFDKDWNKQDMNIGDRVQLDVSSDHIDARVRTDFAISTIDGKNASTRLRAYATVKPTEWLSITGGNSFFTKYAIAPAYLAASDDYVNHGKLTDENGAGLILNFAGVKLASSIGAAARADKKVDLNFGASYQVDDVVSLGFTAQDVTEDARSFSAYAGLLAVEGLGLNAGYTYNYNNTSYLGSTQNALQISTSYTIEDAGLSLYADYMMGFNNVLGDGSGAKYEKDGMPIYAALRGNYKATENLDVNCQASLSYLHKKTE